jgi:hypothetical protein
VQVAYPIIIEETETYLIKQIALERYYYEVYNFRGDIGFAEELEYCPQIRLVSEDLYEIQTPTNAMIENEKISEKDRQYKYCWMEKNSLHGIVSEVFRGECFVIWDKYVAYLTSVDSDNGESTYYVNIREIFDAKAPSIQIHREYMKNMELDLVEAVDHNHLRICYLKNGQIEKVDIVEVVQPDEQSYLQFINIMDTLTDIKVLHETALEETLVWTRTIDIGNGKEYLVTWRRISQVYKGWSTGSIFVEDFLPFYYADYELQVYSFTGKKMVFEKEFQWMPVAFEEWVSIADITGDGYKDIVLDHCFTVEPGYGGRGQGGMFVGLDILKWSPESDTYEIVEIKLKNQPPYTLGGFYEPVYCREIDRLICAEGSLMFYVYYFEDNLWVLEKKVINYPEYIEEYDYDAQGEVTEVPSRIIQSDNSDIWDKFWEVGNKDNDDWVILFPNLVKRAAYGDGYEWETIEGVYKMVKIEPNILAR